MKGKENCEKIQDYVKSMNELEATIKNKIDAKNKSDDEVRIVDVRTEENKDSESIGKKETSKVDPIEDNIEEFLKRPEKALAENVVETRDESLLKRIDRKLRTFSLLKGNAVDVFSSPEIEASGSK